MCDPVTAVVAGGMLLSTAVSAKQASKSRKQAAAAQSANEAEAGRQAQRSEQQFNRLNQKMPGLAALISGNQRASGRGISSTFLTGPRGAPIAGSLGGAPTLLGS